MKGLRLLAIIVVTFFVLGVGSAYANSTGEGTIGLPILGTTGAPALGAPSHFSGVITTLYADGTPVVLESNRVTMGLCNDSGCMTITATLKQTSPGTYAYSFTPPSLLGTITIYVKAYALADDNGRIFPQVDTSIGTYVYAPTAATGSSVPPATSVPPAGTPSATPLTSQAVNTNPATEPLAHPASQASPIQPLLIILSALAIAGSLLTISKRH